MAATLFLITSIQRSKLDLELVRIARVSNQTLPVHQLTTFEAWRPEMEGVALAVPERRWSYDQDYMVRFIETISSRSNAMTKPKKSWLGLYERSILGLDIAFAICFSAFIIATALTIAVWCGGIPWITRAAIVFNAMGIVYGFADVAEDLKLRGIFRHAQRILKIRAVGSNDSFETALADAAAVDAANALTRVKLLTIAASAVGLLAWVIFIGLQTLLQIWHSRYDKGDDNEHPQQEKGASQ